MNTYRFSDGGRQVSQLESFAGKLAVVTGGGSGMGRELVCQLAAQGCSVAACDWHPDAVAETAFLARACAGSGVLVTSHACDVSDEAQVLRFRDGTWRILVGQDAAMIDERICANPEAAYDYAELFRGLVPS
jgi:short chain dehydrogenase